MGVVDPGIRVVSSRSVLLDGVALVDPFLTGCVAKDDGVNPHGFNFVILFSSLFSFPMSMYGLAEDLLIVRELLKEAEDDDDRRLWVEYATLGFAAVGATVSIWSCVRRTYNTRATSEVCARP